MSNHKPIYFLLSLFLFLGWSGIASAQTNGLSPSELRKIEAQNKRDSILQQARAKRSADSLARILQKQRLLDYRDSLKMVQIERRKQDSIRREEMKLKVLEDRRKRDSTQKAIKDEMLAKAAERKRVADSISAYNKRRRDSTIEARAELQKIRDARKKYRSSKQYKDSVELVRQTKRDSVRNAREAIASELKRKRQIQMDSITDARNAQREALVKERERIMDSTKVARTKYLDSVKTARLAYKDSLTTARKSFKDSVENARSKLAKEKKKKDKKSLDQKEAALAMKTHERKAKTWTNEQLLKKKWNIKRRIYQNTVTRYNSYYNAKRKFDGAMLNLKTKNNDVFTKQLKLFPYSLDNTMSQIGNEMDTVIKKCAFDTQIHDPRSKWFDNLYLLMGKAFFYKNDYDGAITAFQFVANEYKDDGRKKGEPKTASVTDIQFEDGKDVSISTEEKRTGIKTFAHHSVRNEALLWLSRTYLHNKQVNEANALLDILENDKDFPERLRDELYLTKAELHFKQKNPSSAIEPLKKAIAEKDIEKDQKNRATYLLAQLYAQNGDLDQANTYFQKTLEGKLPLEMEYYSKLNLAANAIKGVGDKSASMSGLESLAKDDRFSKWKGQTYLSMGQIAESTATEKAKEFYLQSIEFAKTNEVLGAAYAGLGAQHYTAKEYRPAKMAYDSAVVYGSKASPPIDNIEAVKLRKTVLTDVVKYTDIIQREDSLQTLSKMTKSEQAKIIKKELARIQKEEKLKEQEEAAKNSVVTLSPGRAPKSNWYFYNNSTIQKGISDFENKWGRRPLVDNWRRSNSNDVSNGTIDDGDGENGDETIALKRNKRGLKMLNALFGSQNQFDDSDSRILDAMYQLGILYSSRLSDYQRSAETYNDLLTRFPQNEFRSRIYYAQYLNYQKLKDQARAQSYKQKLIQEYPNSDFAALMNDPEYFFKNQSKSEILTAYYDSTYTLYTFNEYEDVIYRIKESKKFEDNHLQAKFDLLYAKTLAGLDQYEAAQTAAEEVIKTYQGTPEEQHAKEFVVFLQKNKGLKAGLIGLGDSSKNKINKILDEGVYTKNKKEKHYLLVYLTKVDGNTMGLKAGFSDYNRLIRSSDRLNTGMNLLSRKLAIISVKSFRDADKAAAYMKDVKREKMLFKNVTPAEYQIMTISASNFTELMKTRDIESYIDFYKKEY